MPTSDSTRGRAWSSAVTTNEAKYRPAASLTTVTEVGSDGRLLDQRTTTSPIFGSRKRPLSRTLNRAFLVKRMACRLSLRKRYRGGATLRPLRLPETDAKKLRYAVLRSARACCSTTDDTSPSHARCGVALASVMTCLDNSASDTYGKPPSRACCRRRSPFGLRDQVPA